MSNTKVSYCRRRLSVLKLEEDDITTTRYHIDYPPKKIQLFSADSDDNIVIQYLDPEGFPFQYDSKGKLKEFTRIRLKQPNGSPKYSQPKGSGVFPFIPPGIIKKYRNSINIETLFITEGEFKSIAGEKIGLDIIGIPGIHNFKNIKKDNLESSIINIIERCKVKNVVLLFDADCLNVEYIEGNDLYLRPNSFYTAIRNFKEVTKPLNVDVYFSHIHSKYNEIAKGLDDLIARKETNIDSLKQELYSFIVGKEREYIHCISISENSISQLRKYFAIDTVDNFYSKYAREIQENVFIYYGHRYKHNGDKLVIEKHKDADLFFRVGGKTGQSDHPIPI